MFVHKMTICNDRIIAVFQAVGVSALFVWAAVNLLEAPAQHNTGVGRALLLLDFTLCPGLCGLGPGSGTRSDAESGAGDVALRSTRWALSFWERMGKDLKAAPAFCDGTLRITPLASCSPVLSHTCLLFCPVTSFIFCVCFLLRLLGGICYLKNKRKIYLDLDY